MPIVNVSWDEAKAYCAWAGGRLPSEAEWEYAARGGSTGARYGPGEEYRGITPGAGPAVGSAYSRYGPLAEVAWYSANSEKQTHPVGQKLPNGFWLYDMLGNVWEWVNDWYDENYYKNSPSQDPAGPASGQMRVERGGSWNSLPREVRVSFRNRRNPGNRDFDLGFRCGGEVAGL